MSANEMSQKVEDLFDQCIEMIGLYGKALVKNKMSCLKSEFDEISPYLMNICDGRKRLLATENIFRSYIPSVDAPDEENVHKTIQMYESDVKKEISKLSLGENNELYQELRHLLLSEGKSLDDSEISTVSEVISSIDPFTKLPLNDPVKNVKCGHVYEKSVILQLIKQKKIVKCPIPGCVAAESVQESDLKPDLALKRYLEKNKQS